MYLKLFIYMRLKVEVEISFVTLAEGGYSFKRLSCRICLNHSRKKEHEKFSKVNSHTHGKMTKPIQIVYYKYI